MLLAPQIRLIISKQASHVKLESSCQTHHLLSAGQAEGQHVEQCKCWDVLSTLKMSSLGILSLHEAISMVDDMVDKAQLAEHTLQQTPAHLLQAWRVLDQLRHLLLGAVH